MFKYSRPKITPIKIIISASIILLVLSFCTWWRFIYSNPANVFERMIRNSLSTVSVSKHVTQIDESQNLNQDITLVSQPVARVQAISVVKNAPNTTITTESIGTLDTDYVRYLDIQTKQKNSAGNPYNFTKILGRWGKSDESTPASGGAQLFNQTLLGIVPVANLPQPSRKQLYQQIMNSNVFKIDMSKVKKQKVNNRPVYVYEVEIQPVPYVGMLKTFARLQGLKQLEQVDPAQYADSPPIAIIFEIDVWSGQLSSITYNESGRSEVYGGYGSRIPASLPANAISVNELQMELQQIR